MAQATINVAPGGFIGSIDEIRVSDVIRYDANFTPEEEFESDLFTAALWHLDEGEGTVALDSSGNNNTGTLTLLI